MMWPALLLVLFALLGLRRVPEQHHAVVVRMGKLTERVVRPGITMIWPFIERVQLVSIEPFSVSLPPQSAITQDEIPIQLQASLDARVTSPYLAATVRDWRIQVVSSVQNLMKDKLEDLHFDQLDEVFPTWIQNIRKELENQSRNIGVEISDLRISNLSPRTRPQS
jgi:regulator of protease activity HflC (stomatin/prohibitin superfamily)